MPLSLLPQKKKSQAMQKRGEKMAQQIVERLQLLNCDHPNGKV